MSEEKKQEQLNDLPSLAKTIPWRHNIMRKQERNPNQQFIKNYTYKNNKYNSNINVYRSLHLKKYPKYIDQIDIELETNGMYGKTVEDYMTICTVGIGTKDTQIKKIVNTTNDTDVSKSIVQKFFKVRAVQLNTQNFVNDLCNYIESIQNILCWRDPIITFYVLILLVLFTLILFFIPFRIVLICFLIIKASRYIRILYKGKEPTDELSNIISRMPTHVELAPSEVTLPKQLVR